MDYYSNQISNLIQELSRLPGIGAKSAARLAFHLIHLPEEEVQRLADTMVQAKRNVRYCAQCCTLTDQEICPICANRDRDHSTIMVVENTLAKAGMPNVCKLDNVVTVVDALRLATEFGCGEDLVKEDIDKFNDVTYTCLNLMANISNLIEPFIPKSSHKLMNMLKINNNDWKYIEVEQNLHLENIDILFERIES